MSIEIIWSESASLVPITGYSDILDTSNDDLEPGVTSADRDIFFKQSGANKLYDCGFYLATATLDYTGGTSKQTDVVELLDWGATTILSVAVGDGSLFDVGDTIDGLSSGAQAMVLAIHLSIDGIVEDRIILDNPSIPYQSGEDIDDGDDTSTITAIEEPGMLINQNAFNGFPSGSWERLSGSNGSSRINAIVLDKNSILDGPEAGQDDGELFPNQLCKVKFQIQVPTVGIEASKRQFGISMFYSTVE